MSRRTFVGAGVAGVAAMALRPRATVADALHPRTPAGLWGAARTDAGLLGLWPVGGRPAVVRLSDRGPVVVQRVLASPAAGASVALVGGGPATVLGATDEVRAVPSEIRVDHLPAGLAAALTSEVDGPLSLARGAADVLLGRRPVAHRLDGARPGLELPAVEGGVATAALAGGDRTWSVLQHPPSPEGDHCSALTVTDGAQVVLHVDDLGAAGAASLVGPPTAPLLAVADGDGQVRAWRLGEGAGQLAVPGAGDGVALHIADGRPVALLASPAGATLLAHGSSGWEVVRDVDGTADCRRVLAVAGSTPEFLVEVADGVRLVDGKGVVR